MSRRVERIHTALKWKESTTAQHKMDDEAMNMTTMARYHAETVGRCHADTLARCDAEEVARCYGKGWYPLCCSGSGSGS